LHNSFQFNKINDLSGHNGSIYSLAHHPESTWFYAVSGEGWIVKWDATGKLKDGLLIADTKAKIFSTAISNDGTILCAGDMNGYIYWIDLVHNTIIAKSLAHQNSIFDLCMINDDTMVSVSGDGYMCIWSVLSQKPVLSLKISNQGLRCLTYDILRQQIIVGSSDNNIYFVNTESWEVTNTINSAHENSVFSVEMAGDLLLSGGRDAHLKIRNVKEDSLIFDLPAHWYTINKIKCIPEMQLVATASRDKTIRFWDETTLEAIKVLDVQKGGHHHSVNTLLWLSEYETLVTAGDDKIIKMWKIIRE
jgi:WD repeat-containing protein 61